MTRDLDQGFVFSNDDEKTVTSILSQYPSDHAQSAVLPLLDLAQRRCGGWLPRQALEYVAQRLNMPPIRVYEIASFYSMFHLNPVGRYVLQICRTTPCWLIGSDEITRACQDTLNLEIGQTTPDQMFTLLEVECLGACTQGPVLQINDTYYEHMTYDRTVQLLHALQSHQDLASLAVLGMHAAICPSCSCKKRS